MKLCDVTLREGDQLPGREYDADAKIAAGRKLSGLGVPLLQAGFPITGEKDRRVIATLADETDATVVGLARAVTQDVDAVIEADADVVEVFAPIADRQLEQLVGKSRSEMLDAMQEAIDRAREAGLTVHLSVLDAFRTDLEDLVTVFDRFPDVGYVTLADTVGRRTPTSVQSFLEALRPHVDLSGVGVHFHDDLGVATANVQTAYELGVGRADVSVSSLGERAGNSALEEVVAIGDLEYGTSFGVDRSALIPTCEEVLDLLGEELDPRRPLLGEEVSRHEAGLHTAAMLEEPSLFEPFDPARFGGERTLLFGSGTGRDAARKLLQRASIRPTEDRIDGFIDEIRNRGPLETEAAKSVAIELFGDGGSDRQ